MKKGRKTEAALLGLILSLSLVTFIALKSAVRNYIDTPIFF